MTALPPLPPLPALALLAVIAAVLAAILSAIVGAAARIEAHATTLDISVELGKKEAPDRQTIDPIPLSHLR